MVVVSTHRARAPVSGRLSSRARCGARSGRFANARVMAEVGGLEDDISMAEVLRAC